MNQLRDKAIVRKTRELHREARQLERISRHRPRVSSLIGEAAKELLTETRAVDCSLTSRDKEELRRRASDGDKAAFAELTRRREPEPVAA